MKYWIFNQNTNDKQKKIEVQEISTQEEEWIWVEGFKGTKDDMTCQGFQYELNKEFTHEGKVTLCPSEKALERGEGGFHLCLNLSDTVSYYKDIFNNKYWKVKALVRKKDYEEYGKTTYNYGYRYYANKLVAKKIIFEREISNEEYLILLNTLNYKGIESMDELQQLRGKEQGEIDKYFIDKDIKIFTDLGFSKTFSLLLLKKICNLGKLIEYNIYDTVTYDKALALVDEGVSKDMCAYLLLEGDKK